MAGITVTLASAIAGTAAPVEPVVTGKAIRLGLSGAQYILPALMWQDGAPPDIPYEVESGAQEATMADGSICVAFDAKAPGTWTLSWDGIEWADVSRIITASPMTAQLVYTNEYTDGAAHSVYVKSRTYSLKAGTAPTTKRYVVNLTLREMP